MGFSLLIETEQSSTPSTGTRKVAHEFRGVFGGVSGVFWG